MLDLFGVPSIPVAKPHQTILVSIRDFSCCGYSRSIESPLRQTGTV